MRVASHPPRRATRATKSPYHHGDLPRALVDAAQHLIEQGDSARLTLRAAAQAAGVSVAAPYRHFADREALLAAVLAKGFRELARRTEKARRAKRDARAALLAVGIAYVGFAADHPAIYRLMFGPDCDKAAHPDLLAAGSEAFAVLTRAVSDCAARGLINAAEVQQAALAGWALSHGLASLHADGILAATIPADPRVVAPQLLGCLIDGLQAGAQGRLKAPRSVRR
jgi:AcrR family transcriptional regulator